MRIFSLSLFLLTSVLGYNQSLELQSLKLNKENATILVSLNNWCSDLQQYKTTELQDVQPVGSCSGSAHQYGKWFKFQATTTNIEIFLKIGKKEGTLLFPYLYLFDENLNEIACKKNTDDTDDLIIKSKKLTPSKWYYFVVYNHNHTQYIGTFSLCLRNKISYDSPEGAINISDLRYYCTEDSSFSTKNATPDGPKSNCMKFGPNFNRWFKFRATTSSIKISVKSTPYEGDFQFPYLTLYNDNLKELACGKYIDEQTDPNVSNTTLKEGSTYYVSIDHQYNEKYQGSFSLCFDDGTNPLTNQKIMTKIAGKLINNVGAPIYGAMITLKDTKKLNSQSLTTDKEGRFLFKNTRNTSSYEINVDTQYKNGELIAYQTSSSKDILRKSIKINQSTYQISPFNPKCNALGFLDCGKQNISIKKGKRGIIGKMVSRIDPTIGIEGVMVYLYKNKISPLDSSKTDKNGEFKFVNLPKSNTYLIKLKEPTDNKYTEVLYLNDKSEVLMTSSSNLIDENGFFHFKKLPKIDQKLIAMEVTDEVTELPDFFLLESKNTITLEKIYFEKNRFTLLESSFTELDELANTLNQKQNITIEISGYTDNIGNETYNKLLSKNRALSVVNYLINKNIHPDRLKYKGYGSEKPITPNVTEKGRQKNRRVEIKVL